MATVGLEVRKPSLVIEVVFTSCQLCAVASRVTLDLFGHRHEPAFPLVGLTLITPVTFVVGQILVAGIPLADTQCCVAHIAVPADKIYDIRKIITVRAPVPGLLLVPVPGSLHDLRIAVG